VPDTIAIPEGKARQLLKAYDVLYDWITNHTETCECGDDVLDGVDEAGRTCNKILDDIEEELAKL
jgi:hypothetical protein